MRFFVSFNAEYQGNELIGVWAEISVEYLTKEEVDEVVEQLLEREPLNFEDIHSTVHSLKDDPYEIKQWMILVALGIMAIIVIITLVIIIWKIYYMRGALGQMGEVFNIVKTNLICLVWSGKVVKEKLYSTTTDISSGRSALQEPTIKPEVAIPLYQAIEEEFPSERQMKRYLSMMKKVKEMKKIPEDSEGIITDTV